MIRNIVVGYDDTRCSQIAAEQAVDIADATQGRLHFVMIAEQMIPTAELRLGTGPSPDAAPAIVEYKSPEDRLASDETDMAGMTDVQAAGAMCEKAGLACTVTRLHGNPVERLVSRAALGDLLVVGRGTGRYRPEAGKLGSMARQILLRSPAPTLLCDVDHIPLRSALLLYEPTEAGGRAVARAGELCSYLNMALTVVTAHPDRRAGERMLRDVQAALRAYQVDVEYAAFPGSAADAVHSETAQRKAGLVVMPQPPRPMWSWQTPSALRSATSLPGALVLVVP